MTSIPKCPRKLNKITFREQDVEMCVHLKIEKYPLALDIHVMAYSCSEISYPMVRLQFNSIIFLLTVRFALKKKILLCNFLRGVLKLKKLVIFFILTFNKIFLIKLFLCTLCEITTATFTKLFLIKFLVFMIFIT